MKSTLAELVHRIDAFWVSQGLNPDDLELVGWRVYAYLAVGAANFMSLVPIAGLMTRFITASGATA